jgi:2-polyprenyl-6-methoxyphenol hydroxylase-like FAD-dependent oxidoreductase
MKKNNLTNKSIAIIGGGPAGLMAAKLLQLNGAKVKVYERDLHESYRLLGGSLDIHKNTGQQALAKAGLLETFYKIARPTGNRMTDKDGNILLDMMPDEDNDFSAPEVDRTDFRNLLLENLEPGTVIWNAFVKEVKKSGNVNLIKFDDGKTVYADLIIVADGTMSRARNLITAAKPQYTGTYCIQGEIKAAETRTPNIFKLTNHGNLGAQYGGKGFFIHTKGNGNLSYYVSFKKPENWLEEEGVNINDWDAVKVYLLRYFEDWADTFKELLLATEEFMGIPIKFMELGERWPEHQNITMIGDAAHVMPPFGGQGANLGLLDALTLCNNLTDGRFTDMQSALDDYEQQMFTYVKPVQQEALHADKIRYDPANDEARIKMINEIFLNRGFRDGKKKQ